MPGLLLVVICGNARHLLASLYYTSRRCGHSVIILDNQQQGLYLSISKCDTMVLLMEATTM